MRVIHTPVAEASHRAWQATGRRLVLAALFLSSRNDGHRRIFQEELFTHSSREKLLVCLMTMWDGQTCHDVSHPYMRDTAHVASTGVVAVWKRSAFGGSMRHVELVDFHRKGIAMTKPSGDPSQEQSGGWEKYPVKRGRDGYSAYLQ